jgi:ABC-type branched-subunit amino acid transport system ATPase component
VRSRTQQPQPDLLTCQKHCHPSIQRLLNLTVPLRLVNGLADAGTAVLLVSSELEELTRVCDRYLVMVRGQIMAELPAGATRERLVNALSLTAPQDVAA